MPLYHFHLADHQRLPDEEGTEFADAAAARVEAIIFAGEYLRDNPGLVEDGHEFRVEVTNQQDIGLFSVEIKVIDQMHAPE